MSFDIVRTDLERIYSIETLDAMLSGKPNPSVVRLTKSDLQSWSMAMNISRSSLCNEIALYLARGFHSSKLAFEFCDAIANDIFGIMISTEEGPPEPFYQIYCAFDAGEYKHKDRPDTDPVETYTRHYIAQIVAGVPISNQPTTENSN
jgi:hypothetical protein